MSHVTIESSNINQSGIINGIIVGNGFNSTFVNYNLLIPSMIISNNDLNLSFRNNQSTPSRFVSSYIYLIEVSAGVIVTSVKYSNGIFTIENKHPNITYDVTYGNVKFELTNTTRIILYTFTDYILPDPLPDKDDPDFENLVFSYCEAYTVPPITTYDNICSAKYINDTYELKGSAAGSVKFINGDNLTQAELLRSLTDHQCGFGYNSTLKYHAFAFRNTENDTYSMNISEGSATSAQIKISETPPTVSNSISFNPNSRDVYVTGDAMQRLTCVIPEIIVNTPPEQPFPGLLFAMNNELHLFDKDLNYTTISGSPMKTFYYDNPTDFMNKQSSQDGTMIITCRAVNPQVLIPGEATPLNTNAGFSISKIINSTIISSDEAPKWKQIICCQRDQINPVLVNLNLEQVLFWYNDIPKIINLNVEIGKIGKIKHITGFYQVNVNGMYIVDTLMENKRYAGLYTRDFYKLYQHEITALPAFEGIHAPYELAGTGASFFVIEAILEPDGYYFIFWVFYDTPTEGLFRERKLFKTNNEGEFILPILHEETTPIGNMWVWTVATGSPASTLLSEYEGFLQILQRQSDNVFVLTSYPLVYDETNQTFEVDAIHGVSQSFTLPYTFSNIVSTHYMYRTKPEYNDVLGLEVLSSNPEDKDRYVFGIWGRFYRFDQLLLNQTQHPAGFYDDSFAFVGHKHFIEKSEGHGYYLKNYDTSVVNITMEPVMNSLFIPSFIFSQPNEYENLNNMSILTVTTLPVHTVYETYKALTLTEATVFKEQKNIIELNIF